MATNAHGSVSQALNSPGRADSAGLKAEDSGCAVVPQVLSIGSEDSFTRREA